MNNKINFKKGYKAEIIRLIHKCGIIPYDNLRLLMGENARMYQKNVRELAEKGYVKIEKRGRDRVIRLLDKEKHRKDYADSLPEEIIAYYDTHYDTSSYLGNLSSKNDSLVRKTVRNAATCMIMYVANVKIASDAKNLNEEIIENDDCFYLDSITVKRVSGYKVAKGNTNSENKYKSSRITGLLVSAGGVYSIYNIGRNLISWLRAGEQKMSTYIERIISTSTESQCKIQYNREAIIISKSEELYQKICMLDYSQGNGKSRNTPLINIDYAYRKMYAVPENENGVYLIKIMTMENWQNKILRSILSESEMKGAETIDIRCDGYNKEKDQAILVFCIPDMTKLKSFIIRARLENNRQRFRIFCFTHQLELVTSLAGKSVQISHMDIKKYYKEHIEKIT